MSKATNCSLWDAYVEQFKLEYRRGYFESASKTLGCALSDAEEFREIDPNLIWSVHSLSGHYCAQGNYNAATKLLKHVVEIKEKILGRFHPDVVNSLEKLALIQLRAKDKRKPISTRSNFADTKPLILLQYSATKLSKFIGKNPVNNPVKNLVTKIKSKLFLRSKEI